MREIGYGVINSIAVKGEDQVTELGAGLIEQDTLLHGVPECTPGITAYPELTNKPKINSIELVGDKSLNELGIEPKRGPEDNYVSTTEKAALHTHANKGILDYITGSLVAAWNSAVSWVNEVGAAHVVNYLNPHKTSFANIEGYPATPSGKYLKDDGTFAVIPSGGGGSGTPLYLSNTNSDISGYKKLSYTPDAVEVIKTITANNSTVYGETYIFDLPIDLSVINAGQWVFDYWRSVSSAAQESYARIESFLRHSDGTETTTYSVESPSIEDTTLTQRIITYTLQQFTVLATDRFGIRVSFRTTRGANTAYSYIVGGVRGHSIISPVPPRHDYLRDKNGNQSFLHITKDESDYCLTKQLQYFVTTQTVNGFSITNDMLGNPLELDAGVYILVLLSTGGGQGSAGVPTITFNGINTGGNFRQINDGGVKYPGLFSSRFDKQYTAITMQLTITPSGRVMSEGNGLYVLSDSDTNPLESRSRGFSLISYTLPITRIDMIPTAGLTINAGLVVQLIRLR